jgi:hypothetical protein
MDTRATDKEIGRTLSASILSAYKEYRENNYHPNPAIYRVVVNEDTWIALSKLPEASFVKNAEVELRLLEFKVEIDNKLSLGEVVFGPEQVLILWKEC